MGVMPDSHGLASYFELDRNPITSMGKQLPKIALVFRQANSSSDTASHMKSARQQGKISSVSGHEF
jgi:hypothetical protein